MIEHRTVETRRLSAPANSGTVPIDLFYYLNGMQTTSASVNINLDSMSIDAETIKARKLHRLVKRGRTDTIWQEHCKNHQGGFSMQSTGTSGHAK